MTGDRRRRILLSYISTGFSKPAAAAVQLLGLPVIAASLGPQRFGALLVLVAVGSFCCLPARGLPSSVSFGIAGARATKDATRISAEFWAGAVLAGSLGIVALLVVGLALWLVEPATLLGSGARAFAQEARLGVASLMLFVAATYFFSWVEGLRTGFEEYHLTNIFTLLASLSALAGIGLAWAFAPSIPVFFVATFAIYPLVQGIDLLLFLWRRRTLLHRPAVSRTVLRETARRAYGYGRAQLGLVLHLQGSVYLAAQAFGLTAGALVGGMVRLFYIVHNLLLSLLNPILPTLRYGAAAGDHAWVQLAVRRTTLAILAGLLLMTSAIALVGDRIVAVWLHLDPPDDPLLFAAFGAMALFYMASQLCFLVLISLDDDRWASRRLLWAGTFGTLGGAAIVHVAGLSALIAVQAVAMLVLAFVPITMRVMRHSAMSKAPGVADRT